MLALAERQGADGVELGPAIPLSVESFRNGWQAISSGPQLLIHNYFPRPAEDFVLNLASADWGILRKSRAHCRQAVDLCAEIGSPFYSVHAGFAFEARPGDLGKDLSGLHRSSLAEAGSAFTESLRELCLYGREKRVRILVENNVLAPFNLVDGRNEMLLCVTARELLDTIASVGMPNIGLLVDTGHLKVSARSLGFSVASFLDEVAPYVEAFHLSENDGMKDDNRVFDGNAWFINRLAGFPSASLVIEVSGGEEREIGEMVSILKKAISPSEGRMA